MTIYLRNMLLRWFGPDGERCWRVIESDPDHGRLILYDCTDDLSSSRAWLISRPIRDVDDAIEAGQAAVVDFSRQLDPYMRDLPSAPRGPRQGKVHRRNAAKEDRDLAWSIIEPIILTPDWIDKLLYPPSCGPLIRHAREASVTVKRVNQRGIEIPGKETSETTIRRLLRAYFRYGQVRNALIPDYQARGRRGPTQPHWKKLGRPHEFLRERPDFLGGNVTGSRDDSSTVLGKLFRMFLDFRIAKQLSYEAAYQQGLSKHFGVNWEEQGSGLTGPQQFLPTKHQFVSHCQAFMKSGSAADTEKWLRKLYGDSVYNLKIKPRRSRVERTSAGPGHVVEIDATPFPIPIVRANDRSALIGTVTVYVVADRKTHRKLAVVPVLDHENYDGHAIALFHAVTGMRNLLAKHGFERPAIARGMYSTIVSDRGPMFGLSADHLVEAFGVTIETNASYAPNSKPLVEAAHEQFQK